jgi:hypothetical protein
MTVKLTGTSDALTRALITGLAQTAAEMGLKIRQLEAQLVEVDRRIEYNEGRIDELETPPSENYPVDKPAKKAKS